MVSPVEVMAPPRTYFSPNYTTARSRFRLATQQADGRLSSLALVPTGPGGDDLTIDIAWLGAHTPKRALIHSSGVHGVEAFAGSAIQVRWLVEGSRELPRDTAVILVHVLNPYGMAWLRRVNEHNVDLNRNFLGTNDAYDGAPDGYAALDPFLNPTSPPAFELFYVHACWLILRHGMSALRQTVAGGQYVNPRGLFFGGTALEDGPRAVQRYVAKRLSGVERLIAVDVHTGLGSFGEDTILVDADEDHHMFTRMRDAFGDRVTPTDPERGPAYRVRGSCDAMYARMFPAADVCAVTQEFGTYNVIRVLKALRAENRWQHHGDNRIDHPTKRALKECFAPDSESWRTAVLERGAAVVSQALELLDRRPA